MTARATLLRQTLLALLGVIALLVQGAIPAAAMAAPGKVIEICTAHGVQKITLAEQGGDHRQAPCPHCDHCLAPALATPTPDLTLAARPVRYATLLAARPAAAALSPYAARAPPRPPGQAPPQS